MAEVKKRIHIDLGNEAVLRLYGIADENLRLLERAFNVTIIGKENKIVIKGTKRDSDFAEKAIAGLKKRVEKGMLLSVVDIEGVIEEARFGKKPEKKNDSGVLDDGSLFVSSGRDYVRPKTPNQRDYLKKIFDNQIVFAIGPAGTGKTYLATAAGLYFLREKKVDRIVLVRPIVEAGENLGFLPGDMKEKIDPYLRPFYDAIYDMIEPRIFRELLQNEIIEIAPLAYMRGRTLGNAFVILDEAQNTTIDQMKMFLTRIGAGSKMVITGDITQIDLPAGKKSGLIHAEEIFGKSRGDEGMAFVSFSAEDVSRAAIVKKILEAYEKYEKS